MGGSRARIWEGIYGGSIAVLSMLTYAVLCYRLMLCCATRYPPSRSIPNYETVRTNVPNRIARNRQPRNRTPKLDVPCTFVVTSLRPTSYELGRTTPHPSHPTPSHPPRPLALSLSPSLATRSPQPGPPRFRPSPSQPSPRAANPRTASGTT